MTPFNIARTALSVELLFLFGILISSVPDAWVEPILLIGVFWSVVAGLTFVIAYAMTQPWWKSPIGRHMMSFMAGFTLILILSMLGYFFPDMPGRTEVRLFTWALIPILFTWRTVILLRIKKYSNGYEEHK